MPILTDGQQQVATIVSQRLVDELDALARDKGISRAALIRDLVGRGLSDYRREQRLLQTLRQAGQDVA